MIAMKKVWLVTGASKGLGLALVKRLLQEGYPVAATTRDTKGLLSALGGKNELLLPLNVSLTQEESVKNGIDAAIVHFGQLDVVVNNAGYGQLGTLEELSAAEAEENFRVNVFGTLNVIRQAMPHFRKRGTGTLFNISSTGGLNGEFPGWGVYCATKFAVAGLTEALAMEAAPHGIRACVVYPGYFKTDFLSQGSLRLPALSIPEYTSARELEKIHLEQIAGNQPNDPDKAAEVLLKVSEEDILPLHLLLGQDCYDLVQKKITRLETDMETWKKYTVATAFAS
jgi:NAD(P)-dependent dehydrogenase (short-subunit alcohol dehydrogenase family)